MNVNVIYGSIDIFNGGGITISNAVMKNFSPGSPLPATGSTTVILTCDFSAMYSNGGPVIPINCTANVKMKADFASSQGTTKVYNTELLQLDLTGSSLPPGLLLRENPLLASNGELVVTDLGGGQYRMASFFDVFTEVSTDGGNTWLPSTTSPARMQLNTENTIAGVPTLSAWGLISLALLFLFIGLFYIKRNSYSIYMFY